MEKLGLASGAPNSTEALIVFCLFVACIVLPILALWAFSWVTEARAARKRSQQPGYGEASWITPGDPRFYKPESE